MSFLCGGSADKVRAPFLSRSDEEGQRRGSERLCAPPVIPLSEPAEYFLVRLLDDDDSWFPKLRRPRRGLEGMLTAPPGDGICDDKA